MKTETVSILASLLMVGCASSSVQVKNPNDAIRQWNSAAEDGDCEQLAHMLHPARYDRVAIDSFVEYCERIGDESRSDLLAIAGDDEGAIFAEVSHRASAQRSVGLTLTDSGWRIAEFDGGADLGSDPIRVFQQLRELAASDVLARTIAVMEPEARVQYTEELGLLRDALGADQLASIDLQNDQAVIQFEIVTIRLRRSTDGRWYFSSMEPGGTSSGYY